MKAGWRKDYIFLNISMPRQLVTRFENKCRELRLRTNAAVVLGILESILDGGKVSSDPINLGNDRVGFSIHYPKSLEPALMKAISGSSKADFFRRAFEAWVDGDITINVDKFRRQSFRFSNAKLSESHNETIEQHVREKKIPSKAGLIQNLLQQFVDGHIKMPSAEQICGQKIKYVYFGVQISSELDAQITKKIGDKISKTALIGFLVSEYVAKRLRYKP